VKLSVIQGSASGLRAAILDLRTRLGVAGAIVSEASRRKTIEVFDAPLTPAEVVRRILADVRADGDVAVARYTRLLDGAALPPSRFRVSPGEIQSAAASVDADLKQSLRRAADNVRAFQEHIIPEVPKPWREGECLVTVRLVPLRRVGVYIPRGAAAYPSTVIMAAIPAQVAGVEEVVVFTPPEPDGSVAPEVLATCELLGIEEIYRVGGAHGVAALAYGTAVISAVEKIVGPGNLYVTMAKKEVFGQVGIDILAGPSEVMIIADQGARADYVAADMLSQAEHAPGCAVLLSPSEELVTHTLRELEMQLSGLATEAAARDSLERYGLAGVTGSIEEALELANLFGPEHLEIMASNPKQYLDSIRSAGAVFLGPYTPEAVGDYVAGPSHVLPTGGAARFMSGLSVRDFMRMMSVMSYTNGALSESASDIVRIAEAEGLCAHARSVLIRFETRRRR